ncbi:MAG: pyridoxamine 5'-phosphate oxidase family protein [Thermomicrobiales bacterium]
MTGGYHAGEIAVQRQAGEREMAERVGQIFQPTIKYAMRIFLHQQRIAVLGSIDARGAVWASVLTGEPGFLRTLDDETVQIDALPAAGDPLIENIGAHPEVGMVVIDLATRQRGRLNGVATVLPDGGLLLATRQVYTNCQQYIQQRDLPAESSETQATQTVMESATLTAGQRAWIAGADTFFIASAHSESGADASHRGGAPGFVRILDDSALVWPDYSGNKMFNTLGNITVNPRAGLLFIDFAAGRTLQLTGSARVIWDADQIAAVPGAERLVAFQIARVRETVGVVALRRRFVAYSRFNPNPAV